MLNILVQNQHYNFPCP